jgi:hypothetical protein
MTQDEWVYVVDGNILMEKSEVKRILAEHGYRWESNMRVTP